MLTCFNALAAAPTVCAEECASSLFRERKKGRSEIIKMKIKKGKNDEKKEGRKEGGKKGKYDNTCQRYAQNVT